jgi:hypothetical protein
MSDETTTTAAATEPAAVETNPSLDWLKTASPDEIMANDRIRGIFGSRIQQERERIGRELDSERERTAREQAEAELISLAKTDQFAFAERYLSKNEQERLAKDLDKLKSSTRNEFAKQLGAGYSALPEWNQLTSAEAEHLARAVAGKADDQALIDFNAAALDVIAERRANAKLAKYRETELPKEREAARQEEAGKRLKNGARPSLARGEAAPTGKGWQDLPAGADFNKAYEENVLGRRR